MVDYNNYQSLPPPGQNYYGHTPQSQQPAQPAHQQLQAPPAQSAQNPFQIAPGGSHPPPTQALNHNIASKFTSQDILILKQLLVAGEKHKWKQITKEINHASPNNRLHYRTQQQQQQGEDSYPPTAPRNVSPTFVIKQYQSLLGLPNNATFFGTLGLSLPYVVSQLGWDELNYQETHHLFNHDIEWVA